MEDLNIAGARNVTGVLNTPGALNIIAAHLQITMTVLQGIVAHLPRTVMTITSTPTPLSYGQT